MQTEPSTLDFRLQTLDLKKRRPGPASKIAQLPTELRALVNQLLDQGRTYEEVVEEMAKHGISLNIDNISKWFNGPYQDYLAALEWRDELQQLRDHAFSFGQEEGNVRFQEGVVQIGLTHILRDMKEDRFKDDAANSLRLFNSLARLSREALVIRKYADQRAKEKILEIPRRDPKRKMTDAEEMAMLDRADDFFGWKSADRIRQEMFESQPAAPKPGEGESSSSSASASSSSSFSVSSPASNEPNCESGEMEPESSGGESEIEIQNSKIHCRRRGNETLISPPDSDAEVGPAVPSAPPNARRSPCELLNESRNTEYESSNLQNTETPKHRNTETPASVPESSIENQNSKFENPEEELCYDCGAPLPPLLPSGQRPKPACIACGAKLYPPDTTFDPCHCCGAAQPIRANGERVSPACRRCNNTLSPAGQRFVSHCPGCGFELPPVTCEGLRISDRCPDCRAPVPLLEPSPPPTPSSPGIALTE